MSHHKQGTETLTCVPSLKLSTVFGITYATGVMGNPTPAPTLWNHDKHFPDTNASGALDLSQSQRSVRRSGGAGQRSAEGKKAVNVNPLPAVRLFLMPVVDFA